MGKLCVASRHSTSCSHASTGSAGPYLSKCMCACTCVYVCVRVCVCMRCTPKSLQSLLGTLTHRMGSSSTTSLNVRAMLLPSPPACAPLLCSLAPDSRSWLMSFRDRERPALVGVREHVYASNLCGPSAGHTVLWSLQAKCIMAAHMCLCPISPVPSYPFTVEHRNTRYGPSRAFTCVVQRAKRVNDKV